MDLIPYLHELKESQRVEIKELKLERVRDKDIIYKLRVKLAKAYAMNWGRYIFIAGTFGFIGRYFLRVT